MMIQTRARRIRRALSKVAKRIPRDEWERIRAFVQAVCAERAWQIGGFGGLSTDLNSSGGALYPLFDNPALDAAASRAQITFNLPVCHLFTDTALVGLLAHEFSHAATAAKLGPYWHDRMQKRYEANERRADALAVKWGFGAEVEALKRERRMRLTPWFDKHQEEIERRVMRRLRAENAAVRARFDERRKRSG